MTKYSGKVLGYLNGSQLTNVEINSSREMYSATIAGSSMRNRIPGPVHYELTMWLHLDDYGKVPELTNGLVALGHGTMCPYCTARWPRGNHVCWNCGGKLVVERFIQPVLWDLMVTSINISASSHEFVSARIEASFTSSLTVDENFPWLLGGPASVISTPTIISINPRVRLCEFCGLATDSGGNCHGCGGPRTPLRELVDMDRECAWCGQGTINGIICESCGTGVGGRTIGELIDRETVA